MKKLKIYIRLNNFFVYRTETTLNQSLAADTILESTLKDAVSEVGGYASSLANKSLTTIKENLSVRGVSRASLSLP